MRAQLPAAGAEPDGTSPEATVLAIQGRIEFSPRATARWYQVATNLHLYRGDTLRTGERSRATLLLANRTVLQVGEVTTLQVGATPESPLLRLLRGVFYFFHRDPGAPLEIDAGGVNAAVLGTDFGVQVTPNTAVAFQVYDGRVRVREGGGESLEVRSGEAAEIRPGESRPRTAVLARDDTSAIQWRLYYPSILDLNELGWSESPSGASPVPEPLQESVDCYRRGDLPHALAAYPPDRRPESREEQIYLAALLLASGQVASAKIDLDGVPPHGELGRLAEAHRRLIRVVTQPATVGGAPETPAALAAEWLAESYARQAAGDLPGAAKAAEAATQRTPESGFAWTRLAALQFALGESRTAEAHLARALTHTPDHAAARALQGFTLAARHQPRAAESAFDAAIDLDPALADAWLGRGLCRIRRGRLAEGRLDLLVAAATEPTRALLRSYLGKAWAESAPFGGPGPDETLATHELELARDLDPRDPTPWLYASLLARQQNRLNEAILDLQESQARNDARMLYRSRLGLDEDRAVRAANLAAVYGDAGFTALAQREASRAVDADPAQGAAHLFLADSYAAQRDPRRLQLRYETAWFSEYLLANLLAPAGAGSLSPNLGDQEYSRMFDRDRGGLWNATTWSSTGGWDVRAAQTGRASDLAWSLDALYRTEPGHRANQDLEQQGYSATTRLDLTPEDGVFVQAGYFRSNAGDLLPRYDPEQVNHGLRLREEHAPDALLGWHHAWQPDHHTLALVSPWNATLELQNPAYRAPLLLADDFGALTLAPLPAPLPEYHSRLQGLSTELQHLWLGDPHQLTVGTRLQAGRLEASARFDASALGPDLPATSRVAEDLWRVAAYVYDRWRWSDRWQLTAGVVFDHLQFPTEFRAAPLRAGSETADALSPKLGLSWSVTSNAVLRGAWTRSLGGVSLDQSYRLEPTEISGFTQAFRGLFPEALTGSLSAEEMETRGVAWDQRLSPRLWYTAAAEELRSTATPGNSAWAFSPTDGVSVRDFPVDLEFLERAVSVDAGYLLDRDFAFQVGYRVSAAEFNQTLQLPVTPSSDLHATALLHTLTLGARYHHPSGFFAALQSRWYRQEFGQEYSPLPTEDFWQLDARVGWRFWQRRAELAVGVLNWTDTDFRLHPLSLYLEPARERSWIFSGTFSF